MIDLIAGSPHIMIVDVNPIYTQWNNETVALIKKKHRRTKRRQYNQYMKTGSIRDFNRSQKPLTRLYFD